MYPEQEIKVLEFMERQAIAMERMADALERIHGQVPNAIAAIEGISRALGGNTQGTYEDGCPDDDHTYEGDCWYAQQAEPENPPCSSFRGVAHKGKIPDDWAVCLQCGRSYGSHGVGVTNDKKYKDPALAIIKRVEPGVGLREHHGAGRVPPEDCPEFKPDPWSCLSTSFVPCFNCGVPFKNHHANERL